MNYIKSIALLGIVLGISTSLYPLKITNNGDVAYKVEISGANGPAAYPTNYIEPGASAVMKLSQPVINIEVTLTDKVGKSIQATIRPQQMPQSMLYDRDEMIILNGRTVQIVKTPQASYETESYENE